MVSFTLRPLTTSGNIPQYPEMMKGCLGPKAGLDVVAKSKSPFPCRLTELSRLTY